MLASLGVPLGFRFLPTDQELVSFFLSKLVIERQPLINPPYGPFYNVIHNYNPFGNNLEPSQIWEKYGGDQLYDQDLYFFCELKKLCPTGSRIDRKIGPGGTWSEGEPSTHVKENPNDHNSKPIGLKRKFRYENEGLEQDGKWFLDEYSVFDPKASKNHYKNTRSRYDFDFVICRLRKNDKLGKKRQSTSQDQSEDQNHQINPTNKRMKKDQVGSIGSHNYINIDFKEEPQSYRPDLSNLVVYAHESNKQIMREFAYDPNPIFSEDSSNTVFRIEELFATLESEPPLSQASQQLPQIAETKDHVAVPTSEAGVDGGVLEASNASVFENLDNQPLEKSYWSKSFMD